MSAQESNTKVHNDDDYIYISDTDQFSVKHFCVPDHYANDLECIMIPHGLIINRTEAIAARIVSEYDEGTDLVCLCVLKGGYKFFADLTDRIQQVASSKGKQIPMYMDFIRVKSYQNDVSGDVQVISHDNFTFLEGKNVLIVEDIVDTGKTMVKLIELLKTFKPKSTKCCSLLVKRTHLSNGFIPDYAGFSVPDKFAVGYAIDYNERFRDLQHVAVIKKSSISKYAQHSN